MRCTSRKAFVQRRVAAVTAGPKLMFGTKWPSITSRWRKSAPPRSTSVICAASFAKSADKIEGAISGVETENGLESMSFCQLIEDLNPHHHPPAHELMHRDFPVPV